MITSEERQRKIESYGNAYHDLRQAIQAFPREMWTFKPAEGWSIHQIIVHITDSEANSFVRCRRFIAEPGRPVLAYDERGWAQALDYEAQSTDDAMELFRWLRLASYNLIKSQPESVWENTVEHPENGTMTFDDWLDVYERHVREHVEQMRGVYEEWKRSR